MVLDRYDRRLERRRSSVSNSRAGSAPPPCPAHHTAPAPPPEERGTSLPPLKLGMQAQLQLARLVCYKY